MISGSLWDTTGKVTTLVKSAGIMRRRRRRVDTLL